MAKYATVTFNPRAEGVVDTFEVDAIEPIDDTSKRVRVMAEVRGPDGQMARRNLAVTMRREDGAWRITNISGGP